MYCLNPWGKISTNDALDTALKWYRQCTDQEAHSQCHNYRHRPGRPLQRPARLLHLPKHHTNSAQLIEFNTTDIVDPYVTLSHRWGQPEPPKLSEIDDGHRKFSLSTMKRGIAVSVLPRIFRDAIRLVQFLGIEYIWIDSLCIIQDKDENGRNPDWEREAMTVGDIYAGGVFNIAAINALNSEGTLFSGPRDLDLPVVKAAHGKTKAEFRHAPLVVLPLDLINFREQVLSSELLSRGWVFQELLLAPATLFCTPEQMWWFCEDGCQNSTYPNADRVFHEPEAEPLWWSRDFISTKEATLTCNQDSIQAWIQVLRFYTKTSVTSAEDRLAAIAGLANVFRSRFAETLKDPLYHSGVWATSDQSILRQICWMSTFGGRVQIPAERSSWLRYPIPSWSPASCKSTIFYWLLWFEDPQTLVFCEPSIRCTLSTKVDEMGRAESIEQCILQLRGVLVDMEVSGSKGGTNGVEFWDWIAWPTEYKSAKCTVRWDSLDEIPRAVTSASRHTLRAIVFSRNYDEEYGSESLFGLLLRPLTAIECSEEVARGRWVRCGAFVHGARLRKSNGASTIEEYKCAFQLDKYTNGEPPEMEDIYIV